MECVDACGFYACPADAVDGIQKTIKWCLDNKEWLERIVTGEYQNYYGEMYGDKLIRV